MNRVMPFSSLLATPERLSFLFHAARKEALMTREKFFSLFREFRAGRPVEHPVQVRENPCRIRGNPRTLSGESSLPRPLHSGQDQGVVTVTLQSARSHTRALEWRSASKLLLTGLAVGVVAVVAGISYWSTHVVAGALAFAMSATLAAAGSLLTLGSGSRKSGAWLISAAVFGAVSWVAAWDRGSLPAIGELAQSLFFVCLGIGILLAGRPRFTFWFEWAWSALAVLILPVQELVLLGLGTPQEQGYSARASWPSLRISSRNFAVLYQTGTWLYVALAVTFVLVLAAQRRRLRDRGRGTNLLVILCSGLFALGAAVIEFSAAVSPISLDRLMSDRSAQMGAAIVVPLAFFASAFAVKWEENTLASRVQSMLGIVTPNTVENALREILRDPGLRIWLWIPAKSCYIDADGHIRSPDQGAGRGRCLHQVRTAGGETLAVCEVDAGVAARDGLLRAAMNASTSALLAAQLQVEKLEQLRAVQARLMEVELATRRELARNIHDGVQQDLAALSIEIGRLRRLCPTDELRDQSSECITRVVEITDELRRITRGLHPPALLERGLVGALEEDAERLGRSIEFVEDPGRLPPHIEIAMYYMLTEALTNVQKHAKAEKVSVSVRKTGYTVEAELTDDGVGGAALTFGGGLHGIEDRARAMRGTLKIESERCRGTRLWIKIPITEGNL
jgi:signal transduction histidine kinase